MEAVPDVLHRPVLVLRPGPRAVPVAVGGARGRPVRLRDGVSGGVPPERRAHIRGARWRVGVRSPAVFQQVRARRGARQLGADPRGRGAVGVRASSRRTPRPRALPGRRGRAAAPRGLAVPRALRALAVVLRAAAAHAARGLRGARAGVLVPARSGGAPASRCAPARARTRPTRAARRSRRTRRSSCSSASPRAPSRRWRPARSWRSAWPPWRGCATERRAPCWRSPRSASPGSRSWP